VLLVAAGDILLCYDARILDEYRRVLRHEKFQFNDEHVDNLLEEIRTSGFPVAAKPLGFSLPDPDDAKFLEAALAGRAECLVTGNIKHYTPPKSLRMPIISPADMLARLSTRA